MITGIFVWPATRVSYKKPIETLYAFGHRVIKFCASSIFLWHPIRGLFLITLGAQKYHNG